MTPLPAGIHAFVGESDDGAHCVIHSLDSRGRIICAAGHCSYDEARRIAGVRGEVGSLKSWAKKAFKKVKKVAKKVAKSKAFKSLAKLAMRAAETYIGAQMGPEATQALGVARQALSGAKDQAAQAAQAAEPAAPALAAATNAARALLPQAPQLAASSSLVRLLPYRERAQVVRRLLGI